MGQQEMSKKLKPHQQKVLLHKGTEAPGSGALLHNDKNGIYRCGQCEAQLFESGAKYDSSVPGLIGWPSFDKALEGAAVFSVDTSLGMHRTEVSCASCGGHLGHIFDADDAATGKHYCINSASLCFEGNDGEKIEG